MIFFLVSVVLLVFWVVFPLHLLLHHVLLHFFKWNLVSILIVELLRLAVFVVELNVLLAIAIHLASIFFVLARIVFFRRWDVLALPGIIELFKIAFIQGLEVKVTELDDVLRLVSEYLATVVLYNVVETLR